MFEKIANDVNSVIEVVWPKEEVYIGLDKLHTRLLLAMGYKPSKQKNWRFCRLLKAAIKASTPCEEITLKGYRKYKRN